MEKLNSINEALLYLKDNEILTTKRKDFFVFKKGKIYRYFNGSSFVVSLEDFKTLYENETFYVYEEDGTTIDNEKDEAYYRYYKK